MQAFAGSGNRHHLAPHARRVEIVSGQHTATGTGRIAATVIAAATAMATTFAAPAEGATSDLAAGTFSVLTYNVAGLPEPLSSSKPATNTKLISARLNAYDIVNVQEDFAYHPDLIKHDEHPFRTPPSAPVWAPGVPFSDGLNTLSDFELAKLDRVTWNRCTKTNCLTPKGFTYVRLRLHGGAALDLYNAHMNAGSGAEEQLRVRRDNMAQLSGYIKKHSAGRAVIVMGDTNSRYTRSGDSIRRLRDDNDLTDAWVQLEKGGKTPDRQDNVPTCKDANGCELVDKILYRSGLDLRLDATSYNNERERFLDSKGEPLSDHNPSSVRFSFRIPQEP
ncbi:endonuclease/exonuclease/phosphatase family protein [Streptomyces sp. NBC_01794]|uniref:endonuclease/exonuclease/phosphatase family protein n=1 Tax=Streptomyces sp. NBC_01794 TaxID=2975942 RepID=UPI0030873F93|nr:endonuclease/exonuclease/phosphatase family protein [Streptomyces sp. NBC_01794]WSB05184.1 endonuclease/exonuclease/phosphatase family protein [Streptomyces sp. NBC_01794]